MKRALFRCDGDPQIGGGHIMRCLTLADALTMRGWHCDFRCNEEAAHVVPALASSPYRLLTPETKMQTVDLLIIDHYGLDEKYERSCRAWAQKIVVLDDLANRAHDCDVLMDQTFGRDAGDYRTLAPASACILTGTRYALLRPEFAALREEALARRLQKFGRLERILVTMGNTDSLDATSCVLSALPDITIPLIVDVVMGAAANHLEKVRTQIESMRDGIHRIELHIAVPNIAELMAAADLCIGAGGTTSWERCCLGLPTIMIEIADNQRTIAAALDRAGVVRNLGRLSVQSKGALVAVLNNMYEDKNLLSAMSRKAADICDGLGINRLLPFLYPEIAIKNNGLVKLRTMEAKDENIILKWQSHPLTRQFARNPLTPTAEEHKDWLKKKLTDFNCKPFIILHENKAAGMLRLDRRDDEKDAYEISILIDPEIYGRGIAGAALAFIREMEPAAALYAEVLPANKGSERLFEKAGYIRQEGNWYLNEK